MNIHLQRRMDDRMKETWQEITEFLASVPGDKIEWRRHHQQGAGRRAGAATEEVAPCRNTRAVDSNNKSQIRERACCKTEQRPGTKSKLTCNLSLVCISWKCRQVRPTGTGRQKERKLGQTRRICNRDFMHNRWLNPAQSRDNIWYMHSPEALLKLKIKMKCGRTDVEGG